MAVVTGALGRLGPVWTKALLEAGASVLAVDLAEAAIPEPFDALCAEHGSSRLVLARGSVTDRDSLERVREEAVNQLGPPSVLVNNAGIDQPPDASAKTFAIEDFPSDAVRTTLDVNLVGTFHACQTFGPDMVSARRGSIVNIGSLYAELAPDPRLYDHMEVDPPFLKPPAYGASKAGVLSLTRYLAALWGPHGVRVNALSPGGVRGDQDSEFVRKYSERVPLRRMAETADLGGPLIFLASDDSSYVTGSELRVDGGFTVL